MSGIASKIAAVIAARRNRLPQIQAEIAQWRRACRNTLNIGVSGSARVGKSTLLQSVSGLDDAQLPSGSGIPVTAVRSRIYHVPGRQRAVLERHTAELHHVTGLQHDFVSQRRDFVFIVLNLGAASAKLIDSLRDDVLRQVNEAQDGLHYRVLEVDKPEPPAKICLQIPIIVLVNYLINLNLPGGWSA